MRRAASFLTLAVTMLLLASSASAHAAGAARSPELRHLDRRIETAERRIHTWNRRLDHWHRRISRAAVAVDRLTDRAEGDVPVILEGVMHGFPTRELDTHQLARAHRFLRSVLKARVGRRGPRELDSWSAVLSELQRERDALLHRDAGAGGAGQPGAPGPRGPVTYEGWAHGFLGRLSAPSCPENLLLVVAWETSESTEAAFNPLATTHAMEGATDFNSVGVKNYRSLDQGLDAARDTLLGGAESYGYDAIVRSLQVCAPAESTASAVNASAWCRGCVGGTYLTGLLPIVRADYASHAARTIATGKA